MSYTFLLKFIFEILSKIFSNFFNFCYAKTNDNIFLQTLWAYNFLIIFIFIVLK